MAQKKQRGPSAPTLAKGTADAYAVGVLAHGGAAGQRNKARKAVKGLNTMGAWSGGNASKAPKAMAKSAQYGRNAARMTKVGNVAKGAAVVGAAATVAKTISNSHRSSHKGIDEK